MSWKPWDCFVVAFVGSVLTTGGPALAHQDDVLSDEQIREFRRQTSIAERLTLAIESVYSIYKDSVQNSLTARPSVEYFRNAEIVKPNGGKSGTLQSLTGELDYGKQGDEKGRGLATWSYLAQQKLYFGRSDAFFLMGADAAQRDVEIGGEEQDSVSEYYGYEEPANEGVDTGVSAGIGGGRRIDISKYRRATLVERELLSAGVIAQRMDRELYNEVANVLKSKKSVRVRLKQMEAALRGSGVMAKVNYTGDVVFLLEEILENSADVIQTGMEVSCSWRKQLTTQQEDADKPAFAVLDVKLSRPAHGGQAEVLVNTMRVVSGDFRYTLVSANPSFSRITPAKRIRLAYDFELRSYSGGSRTQDHSVEATYTLEVPGVGRLDAGYAFDYSKTKGQEETRQQRISLSARREFI